MNPTARLLAASLALLALVTPAMATPPADWSWQNPLPQGNDLEAVWGRAPDDVYAIGSQQTLLHWEGAAWSVASRPVSMPVTDLWGLDDGTLYACGWYGAVLRFDGAGWSELPFPPGASLKAILAFDHDDIFVAETFPGRRIWRFDGAQWNEIGTAPDGIHDLGGTSGSDVYAVGFLDMVIHWDGADWTPVPGFPEIDLTSVWCLAPDDAFILGQGSVLYHFDGLDWTQVGSDGTGAWESDLWADSSSDVWFVDASGGVSHYDGQDVTEYELAVDDMTGVWGDGQGTVHAVGAAGSVATFTAGAWTVHSSAAAYETLNAVWQVAPDDAYAGGSLESAIHWNGEAWTSIRETSFSVWFNDIWAAGPGDVFFVGKAGIQRWDGAGWTVLDDGLRHLLLPQNGIWGWGPDAAVAVADWGAIVRWNGAVWTIERQPDPAQGDLNAVWGATPDDVWAVGPQDEFLHWDGQAWAAVAVETMGEQSDIVGFASDDIWALGTDGELLHFDGVQWSADHALLGQAITGIDGDGPDRLHAVSSWGWVWHREDGQWSYVDTGARTGLRTIAARGEGGVLVAGQGGSVLHGAVEVSDAPDFAAGARLGLVCAPNPFNPSTTIRFELPREGPVSLVVHDARGRRVATLVDGHMAAGPQSTRWDGRDAAGRPVASGIYLAELRAAGGRELRKLTLVK